MRFNIIAIEPKILRLERLRGNVGADAFVIVCERDIIEAVATRPIQPDPFFELHPVNIAKIAGIAKG